MIIPDGDGAPLFFRERISMARKAYECIECKRPIPIGAQYQYAAGKWSDDGWPEGQEKKMRIFRTCMDCLADWQRLIEIVSEHEEGSATQLFGGVLVRAIEDALCECDAIRPNHPLVKKWCPQHFKDVDMEARMARLRYLCYEMELYADARHHMDPPLSKEDAEYFPDDLRGFIALLPHEDSPLQQYFDFS